MITKIPEIYWKVKDDTLGLFSTKSKIPIYDFFKKISEISGCPRYPLEDDETYPPLSDEEFKNVLSEIFLRSIPINVDSVEMAFLVCHRFYKIFRVPKLVIGSKEIVTVAKSKDHPEILFLQEKKLSKDPLPVSIFCPLDALFTTKDYKEVIEDKKQGGKNEQV